MTIRRAGGAGFEFDCAVCRLGLCARLDSNTKATTLPFCPFVLLPLCPLRRIADGRSAFFFGVCVRMYD